MAVVSVALPLPLNHTFTYEEGKFSLQPGDLVLVPFGRKEHLGIVWELGEKAAPQKATKSLKIVLHKFEGYQLPSQMIGFIDWVQRYTLNPLGQVIKLALYPPAILEAPVLKVKYFPVDSSLPIEVDIKLSPKRKAFLEYLEKFPEGLEGTKLIKEGYTDRVSLNKLVNARLITRSLEEERDGEEPNFDQSLKPVLSQEQTKAAVALIEAVKARSFSTILIDGVTGSGKTEVYFEAVETALRQGGQILILLPEIALTDPLLQRFKKRFGFEAATWHADVAPKSRKAVWREVLQGKIRIVIGARSALFLPFKDLQLIIVDEEHESSYKQEEPPIYNARDMAIVRAQHTQIPIILASATPSLETILNIKAGRYQEYKLPNRHGIARLPKIFLLDMRKAKAQKEVGARNWLSVKLHQALQETYEKKEQSLLFLNRRGYAPLTLCNGCGERLQCRHCSAWMILHRHQNVLICHHCGDRLFLPKHCPRCEAEDSFVACGPGVERIEEEVKKLFPEARLAVMTSDTLTTPKQLREVLQQVHDHEVDIIIGTQIMAKGHHFPKLTLVGVVDADLGLSGGDLRASERTYQLLHQVSGRAGREELPGTVYLQTYMPDHPVMQALRNHDREAFLELEILERQDHEMPPFARLASLILVSPRPQELQAYAQALAVAAPRGEGVTILGPAPALISKLRGNYRWRFLVKAPKSVPHYGSIQEVIKAWLHKAPKPPSHIRVNIDIDPYSFM